MTWRRYIGEALDEARCLVVVWSGHSVASGFVQEEADEENERGILIPVRIDDVKAPLGFRSIQHEDLSEWEGDPGHRRVVRGGSWRIDATGSEKAMRLLLKPNSRDTGSGFRPAKSIAPLCLRH